MHEIGITNAHTAADDKEGTTMAVTVVAAFGGAEQ
jgi:hypothetical protein